MDCIVDLKQRVQSVPCAMLSDRSTSYPSSPTRRKGALDTPLDTHEAMLLPPMSAGLHGYQRASAAAGEGEDASGLGLGDEESTLEPARRTVEPWSSLLLSDPDQEEQDVQVGRERRSLPIFLVVGDYITSRAL